MVERKVDGEYQPVACVIRDVKNKTIEQLTAEIEELKTIPIRKNESSVNSSWLTKLAGIYYLLPGFIRRWLWQVFLKLPKTAHKMMGSIMTTSVGMFGKTNGWFIPTSIHPVAFGLGAITQKPAVIDNNIVPPRFFIHDDSVKSRCD